ncbi:DUF2511 domain-containing protein [Candidatus Palauibacter sp.]|uniref:DUF2511 domain-containing protein n=1 Tax=Candidatus Palauibacter sp. TaxID=3101350 RepID=UPI003B02A5ED
MRNFLVTLLFAASFACGEVDDRSLRVESTVSSSERTISRSDFGDEWPFTVESGLLRCSPPSVVTFTSGGTTYAVNGTAMTVVGAGVAIEPIWALAPPLISDIDIVDRLSLSDRQEIFRQLGVCEDRAMERAETEIPVTDMASLTAMAERQDELMAECKGQVRSRFGIDGDEETKIAVEGVSGALPSSTRLRVDISPVIQAGLALCEGQ